MKIENSFIVQASIEEAWELLTDIPAITPCLPGAKLTDETDGVYTGSVKVKVGPITAEYKGSAEFVERDEVNHKAVINGKGRDSRGSGNAQALITAEMKPSGTDATEVSVITDLKISGKVAQFGRGVMQDVSEKLLGQFVDCLANKLAERSADNAAEAAGEPSAAAAGESVAAAAGVQDSAAASSTTSTASTYSAPSTASASSNNDDDVLDLLDVAGGSVTKRFAPAAAGVFALLALILFRRKRRSA